MSILADFLMPVTDLKLLGLVAVGTFAGIYVGAIPGLSVTMAVSILISFTFKWGVNEALALIAGIYYGGVYGGSRSAILINVPGAPAAIASALDGYPLAKMGEAGQAIGLTTIMGVFGGLICGILAAWCYNRFHTMQLPEFLGFFSGKRFVAIATAFLSFLMGLLLPYVWQHIQAGIDALSVVVNGDNQAASTFIFGLVERALIPLGLHHIWYPSFWYSFGDYTTQAGQVIHGDQTIWFKMLEEGVKSFSSDTYQNAGKFMQGEFPLMLFALPAACLAMYHEAHTKNKKIAAGILFSAALTCFLTGITEPVEFTFIFVAPILYVFNAIMAGLAYMTMYLLHAHIAKSFSAGFIDYLSFGILPSFNGYKTNFLNAIIIGIPMGLIYYFTFRFVIRRFDVKTPGRTEVTASADDKTDTEIATEIIGLLGGAHNIDSVGSCITRLRLEVAKSDAVDKDGLNGLGARGVVFVGDNGIQVIFGARAQFIAQTMSTMIGK